MPENGRLWGQTVSEGGLEPPCPLRALAPQASASAYSATRTRDARGTHRLSYLSKPNALRRVPRPVNLAIRCRSPPSVPPPRAPPPRAPPPRSPAGTAAQAHLAGPAAPSGHLSATIGA